MSKLDSNTHWSVTNGKMETGLDGIKFKHIDSSLPSCQFIRLISDNKISRANTSKMFQPRTGHIPLNTYLFQFKRKESTQCPACSTRKETPQHLLLECPAYTHERRKIGPKKGELEMKFVEIISSERKVVALVHYMNLLFSVTTTYLDTS